MIGTSSTRVCSQAPGPRSSLDHALHDDDCVAADGCTGEFAAAEVTTMWVIEQGFEMGRPSIIELELDRKRGTLTAVRVGGASVLVSEGEMEIA
jgi:trans-2,3-dihydro-3-hydroxyanthranilate isomerase